jgi:hypothetical protein
MKKILYFLFVIIIFVAVILVVVFINQKQNNSEKKYSEINIYMIALSDNGVSGSKVGTEDSIIPVKIHIDETSTPLPIAYEKLLSIKERNYGESGLYNTLYQSTLKVDKIKMDKDTALVYLKGSPMLGGVMDIPRVKAQLESTALQFKFVKSVKVYINDVELDQALSLK